MRIDLAGWESKGLRSPNAKVDLTNGENQVHRVSLIQMPNGTGKTTTLDLLKAALTGEARKWATKKVAAFRRRNDTHRKGSFIVRLLIDGEPLQIEMQFDFEENQIRYYTINPGSGGRAPDWNPPPEIHKFLSKDFLKLFIFNGEFADKLFEENTSAGDEAINALCQLYLLDDVRRVVEKAFETAVDKSKKKTSAKTDQGLNRAKSDLKELKQRKAWVVAQKRLQENIFSKKSVQITDLEEKINGRKEEEKETREQHLEALRIKNEAEAKETNTLASAINLARNPISFDKRIHDELIELKNGLDRLKLPESTSSQFFDELMNEDTCICGNLIDEAAKQQIALGKAKYLDQEDSGILNILKQDIRDSTESAILEEPLYERLEIELEALRDARRQSKLARQTEDRLKQQLIDAGDEELKAWDIALEQAKEDRREAEKVLLKINYDGPSQVEPIYSLKILEREIRKLEDKITQITDTVNLRKRIEVINSLLEKISMQAQSQIKSELIDEANSSIEKILKNDPVRISAIEGRLKLVDQDSGSVGQNLSVGYTFLISALNRGNNDFPLVVDSPAGSLDHGVRRRLAELIPSLCTQFIAFTISTERSAFVEKLKSSVAPGDTQFLTIFRKTEGTQDLMLSLPSDGKLETENAVIVANEDYFMTFDRVEE